jgi:hypothetical protein
VTPPNSVNRKKYTTGGSSYGNIAIPGCIHANTQGSARQANPAHKKPPRPPNRFHDANAANARPANTNPNTAAEEKCELIATWAN